MNYLDEIVLMERLIPILENIALDKITTKSSEFIEELSFENPVITINNDRYDISLQIVISVNEKHVKNYIFTVKDEINISIDVFNNKLIYDFNMDNLLFKLKDAYKEILNINYGKSNNEFLNLISSFRRFIESYKSNIVGIYNKYKKDFKSNNRHFNHTALNLERLENAKEIFNSRKNDLKILIKRRFSFTVEDYYLELISTKVVELLDNYVDSDVLITFINDNYGLSINNLPITLINRMGNDMNSLIERLIVNTDSLSVSIDEFLKIYKRQFLKYYMSSDYILAKRFEDSVVDELWNDFYKTSNFDMKFNIENEPNLSDSLSLSNYKEILTKLLSTYYTPKYAEFYIKSIDNGIDESIYY